MHQHWKSAGGYSTVGLEFSLSVIFGLFVGQWFDEKYSGGGWFTAFGFIFGLAAGGRAIYQALVRANLEAAEADRLEQEEARKYLDGKDS